MSLVSVASVSAQSCSKKSSACCAKGKATSTAMVSVDKAAIKAASMDATVEQRTCEKSGTVSFVRKNVCETSGTVSFVDVSYDADTKKFVNVSPKDVAATKGKAKSSCCAGGAAAACTKKSATAVKKTSTAKAIKTSGE